MFKVNSILVNSILVNSIFIFKENLDGDVKIIKSKILLPLISSEMSEILPFMIVS